MQPKIQAACVQSTHSFLSESAHCDVVMLLSSKSALAYLTLFVGLTKAQLNGTGNLFYFVPGTGACGFTNTSDQYVASVSADVFNNFPYVPTPISIRVLFLNSVSRGATSDPNKYVIPYLAHSFSLSS